MREVVEMSFVLAGVLEGGLAGAPCGTVPRALRGTGVTVCPEGWHRFRECETRVLRDYKGLMRDADCVSRDKS